MTTFKRQRILLIAAFAVLALLFGMWAQLNTHKQTETVQLENGTVLPTAHNIDSFNLVGTDNKAFTNENLKGKWSMVFFGFTNCPSLCPTTLSTLNKMYKILEQDKSITLPQIVFISVDPDRDEPSDIAEYLSSFNKHFVGATGEKPQLLALTKQMSVLFMKVQNPHSKDKKDYLIDHSGTILLINPQGQLQAIFSTPHDEKMLSHDFTQIEKNFS